MLKIITNIKQYAKQKSTPLKLNYIYEYGKNLSKQNIQNQSIFLHNELPIRLAKRVIDLETLPYELSKMHSIQKVHNLYINSFEKLIKHSIPNTQSTITSFIDEIRNIKKEHKDLEFDISEALNVFRQNYSNTTCYNQKLINISDPANGIFNGKCQDLGKHHLGLFKNTKVITEMKNAGYGIGTGNGEYLEQSGVSTSAIQKEILAFIEKESKSGIGDTSMLHQFVDAIADKYEGAAIQQAEWLGFDPHANKNFTYEP